MWSVDTPCCGWKLAMCLEGLRPRARQLIQQQACTEKVEEEVSHSIPYYTILFGST